MLGGCSAAACLVWRGLGKGEEPGKERRAAGRLGENFFFFEGWKTGRDVYTNALIRLLFRWAEFYLD